MDRDAAYQSSFSTLFVWCRRCLGFSRRKALEVDNSREFVGSK